MFKHNFIGFKKNIKVQLFTILLIIGGFLIQIEVQAANIPASQVLGQINLNNQPDFLQGYPNSSVINPHGFDKAEAVIIDPLNNRLYVADTLNHRVLVFELNQNNELIDYDADYVLGQSNFSDHLINQGSANASANSMYRPAGLVVDANNKLYVADMLNNRVLVYDVATITNGEPAIAVLGQPDFINNSGSISANDKNIFRPRRLAFDDQIRQLYVADTEHNRVLVYDVATITNGEPAIAVLGQPDFISSNNIQLAAPMDVAFSRVNNTVLYVADTEHNRVLVYDVATITNGEPAIAVLGQPDFISILPNQGNITPSEKTIFSVSGVTIDRYNKNLYVSDRLNNRVLVYDVATITNGEPAIAVLGQPDFTSSYPNLGNAGPSAASIFWPRGLDLDGDNKNLYVTDSENSRVLVYDVGALANGASAVQVIGQLNGNNQPDFTQDNPNSSVVSQHGFEYVEATAIDSDNHRLYVADSNNNRILIFKLDNNNELVDYDADYVLGQSGFISNLPNQGLLVPSASTLFRPSGLTLGKSILYVSDSWNNRVLVYDVSTITNGEPAVAVLGQPDFSSGLANGCQCSDPPTASTLYNPRGIVKYKNNLYVSDQGNNRVLVYHVLSITNGEPAVAVLGQPDFVTKALNPPSASSIVSPQGLAFKPVGTILYVADSYNKRVLVFDTANITNGEPAVAVLGQLDFTSIQSSFPPRTSTMRSPSGLAFDVEHNNLYISDQFDNRVLVYDVSTITNGEPAVAVLGQPNFSSWNINQNGNPSNVTLNSPRNISYGGTNRALYVSDRDNHRVMVWKIIDLLASPLPNGQVGSLYNYLVTPKNVHGIVQYTLNNGSLPNGLALNSSTGVISGTPTAVGTASFTIKATDMFADGSTLSDSQTYSITIN